MAPFGRILTALAWLSSAIGLALGPAGPTLGGGDEPDGRVTLTLPREPAEGEAIVLRLSAGVLPRGAKVVVRTADGAIAGSVAPFGVRPGRKAGVYTVPIPTRAVKDGKVTLRYEVLEKGAKAGRAPARTEVEGSKLALIRVEKRPESPAR